MYGYGEEDWFTSQAAINRTKAGLTYCNENGYELDYFAFGWCYDAGYPGVGGSYDPVYHTRWGGETIGSPDGTTYWGLDSGDSALTDNRISMQTYLDATVQYINHCESNDYATKVMFTTGPVDNEYSTSEDETGYQQYLKYEYIRNFVAASNNYILFDYADILTYNDDGVQQTTTWTDNNSQLQTFPIFHDDNYGGSYVAHIGTTGALRLAKAMWVLLAKIEGWDGGPQPVEDTEAPSVPTNLEAIVTSLTSADLTWDASTDNVGITGYRIFRDGVSIGTSTTTSLSDNGLGADSTFSYTVAAYDAAGNESDQSSSVEIDTHDNEPPSVPANLNTLIVDNTSVSLSWDASIDNVGVTGYRIYRDGVSVGTCETTYYRDIGLSPGNSYNYTVAAFDDAGNESEQCSEQVVNLIAESINFKNNNETNKIVLYPNPASKYINLEMQGNENKHLIEIFTLSGTLIFQKEFNNNVLYIEFDKLNIKEGFYFIKVINSNQNYINRFSVKF